MICLSFLPKVNKKLNKSVEFFEKRKKKVYTFHQKLKNIPQKQKKNARQNEKSVEFCLTFHPKNKVLYSP